MVEHRPAPRLKPSLTYPTSSKTQPFIHFCNPEGPEAETWRRKLPHRAMDMRQKNGGVIGVTGLKFHCSSPSVSEPLWFATARRAQSLAEPLIKDRVIKDRGLVRSCQDFGLSAAKMRVEARLKHRIHVNPNLATEKSVPRLNAMKNKEFATKKKGRVSCLNTSSNTPLCANVRCQSQCDGFAESSAKTFVTVTDKNYVHDNHGQGWYVNPMFGASTEFQRRIAEMSTLEMDTMRWERAMRAKRKLLPSTLPPPSKES